MNQDSRPNSRFTDSASAPFTPGERCRRWLLIGVIALLTDLAMGVGSTVLEFQHWGEEGFTPDVVLAYLAILPQVVIVVSYLVLAREAGTRGLWKSVAGMLACYLLVCLLGLVLMEVLPPAGDVAIMIAVCIGILGVLGFWVSAFPQFEGQPDPGSNVESSTDDPDSSEVPGWVSGLAMFLVLLVVRGVYRQFIRPVLPVGLDVDDWQLIEFFVVVVFGVSFCLWFAITKIRHRRTLGAMAGVAGCAEILILLVHIGMAITILAVLVNEAAVNPKLDDDGLDQLLDPWTRRASLISAISHAVWSILTCSFFVSIVRRFEADEGKPVND